MGPMVSRWQCSLSNIVRVVDKYFLNTLKIEFFIASYDHSIYLEWYLADNGNSLLSFYIDFVKHQTPCDENLNEKVDSTLFTRPLVVVTVGNIILRLKVISFMLLPLFQPPRHFFDCLLTASYHRGLRCIVPYHRSILCR